MSKVFEFCTLYQSAFSDAVLQPFYFQRFFSSRFFNLRIQNHSISDLKIFALPCKLLAVLMDSPLGARSDYKSDYSRTYGKHGVRSSG